MKYRILLFLLMIHTGNSLVCGQVNERVYLQTDKQLYLAGELLWLKLYTTNEEGKLMSLSKVGYVELIHDSIPEVQIKVDIRNGTGEGWMVLPVMLPTGYYRMIAYTRFMRNEGENAFFEKCIAIVNPILQNNDLDTDNTGTPFLLEPVNKRNNTHELFADKLSYTKRDKGELKIKGLPVENISFGISIASIEPTPIAANTTINDWKKHLPEKTTTFENILLLPELEGAIIDGVLIDQASGNPTHASDVINLLSFPGKDIQLFAGKTAENGKIAFYTQSSTAKRELATAAIASSGKKYRIDIQSPYHVHTHQNLPHFKPDSAWIDFIQKRNLSMQVTNAYLADSISIFKENMPYSYYKPYRRYVLDDYTRFHNMEEVFIEFITLAGIRRTNEGRRFALINEKFESYSTNVLVLFDNIPITNHELMSNYNPLLIKTIELFTGRYVFGGHLFEGIISFYSYNNDFPGMTFEENTQIFDYEGTQPYRYFYAPKYDETTISSLMPDFRQTLLWEPSVQSYGQNEMTIPFTTSDIPGIYMITVEGIGANGTVVQANYAIEVE